MDMHVCRQAYVAVDNEWSQVIAKLRSPLPSPATGEVNGSILEENPLNWCVWTHFNNFNRTLES